jgi:hypothetical protein
MGMTLLSYFLALRPFLTAMRRLVEATVCGRNPMKWLLREVENAKHYCKKEKVTGQW